MVGEWLAISLGFGESVGTLPLALGIVLVGMAGSLFHLTRPLLSWRVVQGIGHSWLSREALAAAAFAVAIALAIVLPYPATVALSAGIGLAAIWAIALVYQLPYQIGWRGRALISALSGTALIAAAYMAATPGASQPWRWVFVVICGHDWAWAMIFARRHARLRQRPGVIRFPRLENLLRTLLVVRIGAYLIAVAALWSCSWLAVVAAGVVVVVDRTAFYAATAQVTPHTQVASLRGKRLRAAALGR